MIRDAPFGRVGEGASTPFMRGGPYLKLLQAYVLGSMGVAEFQASYRRAFLHGPETERPNLQDELGRILHHMFTVLDSFTADRKVLAADPEFFVSEKEVREAAVLTLQRLRILNRSPS